MLILYRVLCIAAALLFFDILFSFLSTCDPASYPNPKNQSYDEYCSGFRGPFVGGIIFLLNWFGHILHAYGEAVIATFTIILAGSTIALWRSTEKLFQAGERQIGAAERAADAAKRSAIVAERALVEVQRALVVNSKILVGTGLRNGRVIAYTFDIHFTNTGSTTAKNLNGNSTTVVFDGKMPADFRYPDREQNDPGGGICGPGVTIVHPLGMAVEDLIAVEKETKEAFIYGWAEYDDIFETTRRRRTEFCVQIRVMTDPTIIQQASAGASIIMFKVYGPYNGIDDDCFYKPGQQRPVGGLPPITQPPPPENDPPTQTYQVRYGGV